jgi:hypothetical protein
MEQENKPTEEAPGQKAVQVQSYSCNFGIGV